MFCFPNEGLTWILPFVFSEIMRTYASEYGKIWKKQSSRVLIITWPILEKHNIQAMVYLPLHTVTPSVFWQA